MTEIRPAKTRPPWADHATDCLTAAMRRDNPAVQAAASKLIVDFGPDIIWQVMLAWVDTALASQGITQGRTGQPAQIIFGDVDTGHIATDAHDVAPDVAWVGRLMNSRIADDRDTWNALMDAIPLGKENSYATTLLECCAQTVRLSRPRRAGGRRS